MTHHTHKIDKIAIIGQPNKVTPASSMNQQAELEGQAKGKRKNLKKNSVLTIANNVSLSSQQADGQNQSFNELSHIQPLLLRPKPSLEQHNELRASAPSKIPEEPFTPDLHHHEKLTKKSSKKNKTMILRKAIIIDSVYLHTGQDECQVTDPKIRDSSPEQYSPNFKTVSALILEGLESDEEHAQYKPTEL